MKKTVFTFFILVALMVASCNDTGLSVHQRTISEVVQTINGTKSDLNFRVVKISEQGKITVNDSIKVLQSEFEESKASDIRRAKGVLNMLNMLSGLEKTPDTDAKRAAQQTTIDSLQRMQFVVPEHYSKMSADKPLAVVVRCTYKIDVPISKSTITTVEETFDFYLSVDGKRFYKKRKPDR